MERKSYRAGPAGEPLPREEMLERLQALEPSLALDVGIDAPQERFRAHSARIERAELHAERELQVAQDACRPVGEGERGSLDDGGIDENLADGFQVEGPGDVRASFEP